jgi:hypothetical protein
MRRFAWVLVMVVAVFGALLLLVSMAVPAIQQAAIGSMITGFAAVSVAFAIAAEALHRLKGEGAARH